MKILIDARPVVDQFAGAGSYVYNLLANLAALPAREEFSVLAYASARDALPSASGNYSYKLVDRKIRKFYSLCFDFFGFPPVELFFGKHDLIHQTFYGLLPALDRKTRIVSTILDVAFLTYPKFFVPNNLLVSKRALKKQLAVSHKLSAISHFTKRELVEKCGVEPDRIKVIHMGVDPPIISRNDGRKAGEIIRKFGIDGKYVLFVSTLEPRKNVVNLVRAFSLARKNGLKLVLAGKRGWYYDSIFAEVEKLSLRNDVIFTGYITDTEKHALLSGAELFAYPSIYEGFGIPILEAMSYGLPVIAGNNSSMIEVVGDAGILVEASDVDAIADKMRLLLQDDNLRAKLRPLALAQAAKFSWKKTALETLALYREVLGKDKQ